MTIRRVTISALCLLALAACSEEKAGGGGTTDTGNPFGFADTTSDADPSGDGSDPDTNARTEALRAACAGVAGATCAKWYHCPGAETVRGSIEAQFGFTDEASCNTVYGGLFFENSCATTAQSVAAGRSDFDAATFAVCQSAVDALTCADVLSGTAQFPAVCDGLPFEQGIQAEGEACARSAECQAPDSRCSVVIGVAEADAVCEPAEGAVCTSDAHCPDTHYCDQPGNDFAATGPDVAEGACAPRRALGEPCDDAGACLSGLFCTETTPADPATGIRQPGICGETE